MGSLRRDCRQRLEGLALPRTYDVRSLCEHVGRARGRTIHLLPMHLDAAGPCGIVLSLPGADYVVYEVQTSRHHQEHIIAHELAHLICGHRTADHAHATTSGDTADRLFPDLDPGLVQDLLYREHYSDVQEQEAEVMAFLIGTGLRATDASTGRAPAPDTPLGRIQSSLDWRRRDET
ncbi:toxin [Streptomyces tsukubensis]|uniref:Toxin n=1 Tax=Streptomyces tsukubensis TaxID=83656 RepID=A0A1V4A3R5_9ACTN|nr:toxin [Streptomyces tsukubensis]QFR97580.1 toxin [Streptomyces tsukubensis]